MFHKWPHLTVSETPAHDPRHAGPARRTTRVRNQRLIPGYVAVFCYTSGHDHRHEKPPLRIRPDLDRRAGIAPQVDELERAGCLRIFTDTASGSLRARPHLDEVLSALHAGDVLVVVRLDRLGRSLRDLIAIVEDLNSRGVGLVSLRESIDTTTTAAGRPVLHIFASLAEFERGLIIERTHAGIAAARARGRLGGRPPALAGEKLATTRRMHASKEYTIASIARSLGVSRATLYRRLAAPAATSG